MARAREAPVPAPGQAGHISATSQLSRENVSSSSPSSSGSEVADSDSHSDTDDSGSSESSSSQNGSDTDTSRRDIAAVPPRTWPAYEPPHGFQPLSTDPSSSPTSRLFDPANLAGKQIWHIIAPASVPVSALKEVSTQKVMNGEAVMSHNDSDYGFATLDEAAGSSQTMLLVPGKTGYQPGMWLLVHCN
jgi:hypothetical protein